MIGNQMLLTNRVLFLIPICIGLFAANLMFTSNPVPLILVVAGVLTIGILFTRDVHPIIILFVLAISVTIVFMSAFLGFSIPESFVVIEGYPAITKPIIYAAAFFVWMVTISIPKGPFSVIDHVLLNAVLAAMIAVGIKIIIII